MYEEENKYKIKRKNSHADQNNRLRKGPTWHCVDQLTFVQSYQVMRDGKNPLIFAESLL